MDPITTALVAGAAAALTDVASDAVRSAYNALKDLLKGKVNSLTNLEEDPTDQDYRNAATKEIKKKGLDQQPAVQEKAKELVEILKSEPPETLAKASIDIRNIQAVDDVLIKAIKARRIEIGDLQAGGGGLEKNS